MDNTKGKGSFMGDSLNRAAHRLSCGSLFFKRLNRATVWVCASQIRFSL